MLLQEPDILLCGRRTADDSLVEARAVRFVRQLTTCLRTQGIRKIRRSVSNPPQANGSRMSVFTSHT
jgi:hypothetical protein